MTRTFNINNKVRQIVLAAYRSNPSASLAELVKLTGYSQTAVYYHLNNLNKEGVISRENRPRGGYMRTDKRLPQTGYQSEETRAKKAEGARKNLASFRDKTHTSKNKKRTTEEERIEEVVRMAKEKEAAGILTDGVNVFQDHRVRRVLGRKAG